MPLSQDERDKIREIEALKKEIRDELQPNGPGLGKFLHEAALLFLGFVLTIVLGGYLTSHWKQLEWTNQQKYLFRQRELDTRYALIDDVVKSVAETNTAAEDILALYKYSNWTAKDAEERRRNWRATSRNWRIVSKVLREKLLVYFDNPEVESVFNEIVLKRHQLGVMVSNLPPFRRNARKKNLDEAQEAVNGIRDLLHKCASLMAGEVKRSASHEDPYLFQRMPDLPEN